MNASAHGGEVDQAMFFIHILMLVLFIGWGVYFIYAIIRFRRSKNPKADYGGVKSHTSSYLEIVVAIIEAVLLIAISIPFWAKQINAFPDPKTAVHVKIIAEQFAWNVHYPGADGIFGRTDIKLMNSANNPIGLDRSDEAAKDDIVMINQLHLPVNKPVIINLSTKDVIHSFALPLMRVKQDVIPGMSIPVWFTPTKTGQFEIACAQLCGLGHYRMKGYLTVHSKADYEAWLTQQASAAQEAPQVDDFWN